MRKNYVKIINKIMNTVVFITRGEKLSRKNRGNKKWLLGFAKSGEKIPSWSIVPNKIIEIMLICNLRKALFNQFTQ